jgi:hypothetical protein
MPLVEAPVDAVPLPAKPALDDPLAEEAPAEDAPLEPVAPIAPDELPSMYSDPPHPTSSGTAINTVTAQLKTRASSEDLMRSCRAMDVPSRASRFRADPSTCRVPFCAKRGSGAMGSGRHVSFFGDEVGARSSRTLRDGLRDLGAASFAPRHRCQLRLVSPDQPNGGDLNVTF